MFFLYFYMFELSICWWLGIIILFFLLIISLCQKAFLLLAQIIEFQQLPLKVGSFPLNLNTKNLFLLDSGIWLAAKSKDCHIQLDNKKTFKKLKYISHKIRFLLCLSARHWNNNEVTIFMLDIPQQVQILQNRKLKINSN